MKDEQIEQADEEQSRHRRGSGWRAQMTTEKLRVTRSTTKATTMTIQMMMTAKGQ
jgi:hypothetical protein